MSGLYSEHYINSGQYLLEEPTEWLHIGNDYAVCKEGFVCHKGKILKPHRGDIHGHLNVRLVENGKVKEEYIHRLVAKMFIPNPKNLPIVRHLDDNKENNHVDNLEWGTQKDNIRDCMRNGNFYRFTKEDREKSLIKQRKPVVAINNKGHKLYFDSQTEAASKLGLHRGNVRKVLSGQRKHTGGYSFKFVEGRSK